MDISSVREQIYQHFQNSEELQKLFFEPENAERYSGYYTSMYLIQDTYEGIHAHIEKGFAADSLIAYIEFWGVMQAVFIQQDAIAQLHEAIIGSRLDAQSLENWREIRALRNACAGHPAKKDRPPNKPLSRTFMGRNFGSYSQLCYEKWESPDTVSHPRVNLIELLQRYESEAAGVLGEVYGHMQEKWAKST